MTDIYPKNLREVVESEDPDPNSVGEDLSMQIFRRDEGRQTAIEAAERERRPETTEVNHTYRVEPTLEQFTA